MREIKKFGFQLAIGIPLTLLLVRDIIEVDGGIHDFEYRQTLDRIRQRALENMRYRVQRVKMNKSKFRPRI
jgi:very-short-patch-repair endonuclease